MPDSILYGQSNALDRVFDVNEASCLTACAVDCDGMVMSHLCTKSVQHSAIITIDINSIDKNGIHFCLLSADSPNNSLMEFSDFEAEVFLEVEKCHIVETLCHVIN